MVARIGRYYRAGKVIRADPDTARELAVEGGYMPGLIFKIF